MDRRAYLLGLTGISATLAGCDRLDSLSGTEDDGTPEPAPQQVKVVEQYFTALNDGDTATASRLRHPESPVESLSEDRADYYDEEVSIGVEGATLREEDGETAEVTATVLTEAAESGETSRVDIVFELRETENGWRLYGSRVLESTPGSPEPTVETTREEQSRTNRVDVKSRVGTNIENNEIQTVEMVIGLAPGADAIDLSRFRVEWVDNTGVYRLGYGTTATESTFTVESIQDENGSLDGSRPILDDRSDRALLRFTVTAFREGGLPEGSSVRLSLETQSGGTTEAQLTVPQTLSGATAVNL
jgi:archaellin